MDKAFMVAVVDEQGQYNYLQLPDFYSDRDEMFEMLRRFLQVVRSQFKTSTKVYFMATKEKKTKEIDGFIFNVVDYKSRKFTPRVFFDMREDDDEICNFLESSLDEFLKSGESKLHMPGLLHQEPQEEREEVKREMTLEDKLKRLKILRAFKKFDSNWSDKLETELMRLEDETI